MQPLIAKWGMYRVWMASLEVMGWPLSWCPSMNDALKIEDFLTQREGKEFSYE